MNKFIRQTRVMEPETIEKNGVSLKNLLICSILLLACCSFTNKAFGQSWSLNNGALTISDNSAFSGYPYPWANRTNEITTLNIGSGVISIPSGAFNNCRNLKSVTIEDSGLPWDISDDSFSGCPIETLYLGRDAKYINQWPFINNAALKNLTISDNVTYMNGEIFEGCTSLQNLNLGNSLEAIPYSAFYGCSSLPSITIPQSVTTIGSSAFYGCTGLTSLFIHQFITSVSNLAFANCRNLKSVTIEDSGLPWDITDDSFSGCPIDTLYLGRDARYINQWPFRNNAALKNLTIGNNVSYINDDCFSGCTGLTQITSNPTTPPTIYSNTFYNVKRNIPVHIDCNYLTAYQLADYWKEFTNYQCPPNNINEVENSGLKIYPNPVKNELFIKTDLQIKKVEISDLTGHNVRILHATPSQNGVRTISISSLLKGIYFVKVYTDKGLEISKIVKE